MDGIHSKQARLDDAIEEIHRRFGPQALTKGRLAVPPDEPASVDRISTGFQLLDEAIDRGLPKGQVSEFLGRLSSGKTTLALKFLTHAQRERGEVCYVDLSHSFDPNYAHRCGLDLSRLLISAPTDLTETLVTIEALVHSESLSALVVDTTGCAGIDQALTRSANILGHLLAPLHRSGTVLLVLSDYPPIGPPIFTRLAHYASVRLQVVRERWLRDSKDIRGYEARVRVLKSRHGPSGRSVRLSLEFNGSMRDGLYLAGSRRETSRSRGAGKRAQRSKRTVASAMDNGGHAYTTGELAALAGVSSARIRQLLNAGRIRGRRFGPLWSIPRIEAERWLEEKR